MLGLVETESRLGGALDPMGDDLPRAEPLLLREDPASPGLRYRGQRGAGFAAGYPCRLWDWCTLLAEGSPARVEDGGVYNEGRTWI